MNNQDMYEIHPINFEVLKDKLADMQKKAKKLGVAPVKLVEHGTKVIDHKRVMPGGKVTTFQEEQIVEERELLS